MAQGTISNISGGSGSTTNGYYLMSPDGTLFQWGRVSVKTTASTGNSYHPYYGSATVTFPVAFAGDAPRLFTNVMANASWWTSGTSLTAPTLTTAEVSIGGDANNTTYTVNWIAVGRWK